LQPLYECKVIFCQNILFDISQVLVSLAACVCLLEAAPAPQFDPVSAAVLAAATKAIIIKGWEKR
jgi:hypothetical protein